MQNKRPLQERFDEKYTPEPMSGCWLWTASCKEDGYGMIGANGKVEMAHRVSWELHNGPIPKGEGAHGTCVLHKCDTPSCVNPDHLFLGTNADNMADREAKGRGVRLFGADHGGAKLTEAQALEIYKAPGIQREIAVIYGVTQAQVSNIKLGKQWQHLTGRGENS